MQGSSKKPVETCLRQAPGGAAATGLVRSATLALALAAWGAAAQQNPVVVTDPSGLNARLEGTAALAPAQGTSGSTIDYNWRPYTVPGQVFEEAGPPPGHVLGEAYDVAYQPGARPVQTTDWWIGAGLQYEGWVISGNSAHTSDTDTPTRTFAMFNEPFQLQFVDLAPGNTVDGLPSPAHGLRFWNQRELAIYNGIAKDATGKEVVVANDAAGNKFGRGDNAVQLSPLVTVGLDGVHPVRRGGSVPQAKPWTNVRIEGHSDWGVAMSYGDAAGRVAVTFANGSPFVWMERTQGSAPFAVWAGTVGDDFGATTVWRNEGGALGLTVSNKWIPPLPLVNGVAAPDRKGTSAYVIWADAGTWLETKPKDPKVPVSYFRNDAATKVVVLAMPHNVDPANAAALKATMDELAPYAWQRITATRLHFPPMTGSDTSVTVAGTVLPLGYDEPRAVLRMKHAVTSSDLRDGRPGTPLQLVFPHHRKAMRPEDRGRVLSKYVWYTVKGELLAYPGATYVRELKARGVLPFLPGVALKGTSPVDQKNAAEELYRTLKTWFYLEEPATEGHADAFRRNFGLYGDFQNNTYFPNINGELEAVAIADELSQAEGLTGDDPDLHRPKKDVAAEIRDFTIQVLKETVGRWADVTTAGFFQYNPEFNSLYGFPDGYGSVQSLNDKHFHWGYFLRAAAVIGRHDRAWLDAHLPFFDELRADVANFDRTSTRYPFLRNFSPFYGHNWANGVSNGGIGADQESTSEAVHFAAAVLELGEILGRRDWRDIGLYLYEEEVLAIQQYWFNVDSERSGTTCASTSESLVFNGNWPADYVRYRHGDGCWVNTISGQLFQPFATRGTFFGAPGYPAWTNAYIIHAVPLAAATLHLGRDPKWLADMWSQLQREAAADPRGSAYDVVLAGLQARLPGSGTGKNDPGPRAALARIDAPHVVYYAAPNAVGRHFAYTLGKLGQLDASVLADTASYAVFCEGGRGAPTCPGTRSYVAYNPSGEPLPVTFRIPARATSAHELDAPEPEHVSFTVPPHSLATKHDGEADLHVDRITPPAADTGRLYLRRDVASADCGPLPFKEQRLATTPGAWRPQGGTSSFPTDNSPLADSLVCVPARPDTGTPNTLPGQDPADPSKARFEYVRTWVGSFHGTRETKQDSDAHSHFAIYANQSLFPGWQLDPRVRGAEKGSLANTMAMQISYDFGSGTWERVEWYQTVPLSIGNTFHFLSRVTDERCDFPGVWPAGSAPLPGINVVVGGLTGQANKPFPATVTNGRVKVELYGGTNRDVKWQYPVNVSVDADPATDRASWVRPPYR